MKQKRFEQRVHSECCLVFCSASYSANNSETFLAVRILGGIPAGFASRIGQGGDADLRFASNQSIDHNLDKKGTTVLGEAQSVVSVLKYHLHRELPKSTL